MTGLFHYTSFEGLKGILEKEELWFSNTKSLNDSTELIHSKPIFMKVIKGELEKYFKNKMTSEDLKNLIEHECNFIYQTIWSSLHRKGGSFVFSTCIHDSEPTSNDGLLSMWRGYAGDGGMPLDLIKRSFQVLSIAQAIQP